MKVCTMCGDKFTGEQISEMRSDHEEFSLHPFVCPDCYDRLNRMDPADQVKKLVTEGIGDAV